VDELQQNKSTTDDKLLAMDDFFPKFLDYYRYKNQLWGLPFYGESLMLYYNAAEFQAAGIDKAPNTVEDLEQACSKIKAGGRMAGIALRGTNQNSDIYPFLAWVYGYGGFWVDPQSNEMGLDKPETIAAADAWGHFMRDYAPPDVASYFWNEVQLAMQQGKAAIIMDATNFGPRLEDPAQSKISGKVGYGQLPEKLGSDGKPLGPDLTKGRFGYSDAAYALSVPRSSKNKEAAWLFTQWATSPDVMLQTTQLGLRADPTRRSSLESPKFAEKYNYGSGDGSFAKNLAQAFEYAMPNYWPRMITGTQLADTLGTALGQILTGQRSAKDAFTDAQQKSVDIQKQAGLLS
jgi:multiple sugar transport system substrate-binding protein/sorbitol/mannitol transport system substrate-binding protein